MFLADWDISADDVFNRTDGYTLMTDFRNHGCDCLIIEMPGQFLDPNDNISPPAEELARHGDAYGAAAAVTPAQYCPTSGQRTADAGEVTEGTSEINPVCHGMGTRQNLVAEDNRERPIGARERPINIHLLDIRMVEGGK